MAKIVNDFQEHDNVIFVYPDTKEKEQLKCAVNTNEFLFYSNNPESVY